MTRLFSIFSPQSWFSINLNWLSMYLALLVLPVYFWVAKNQSFLLFKVFVNYITNEFKSISNLMRTPGLILIPLSLLIFIILNNTLGLISYVFTASSHLVFTISLALPLWVGHYFFAWIKSPTPMFAHLVPLGTPFPLMPLMVMIELIRRVIRPLTLSVRLAANIVAGHLLLTLLRSNIRLRIISFAVLSFSSLILLRVLECGVRLIQAYVFRMLSSLYIFEVETKELNY